MCSLVGKCAHQYALSGGHQWLRAGSMVASMGSQRGMHAMPKRDAGHDAWLRMNDVNHAVYDCQRGYLHSINFAMEVEIGSTEGVAGCGSACRPNLRVLKGVGDLTQGHKHSVGWAARPEGVQTRG